MVNGINKPPKVVAEHAALGERLAESNRQLAAMQAEHRQLLVEMEELRLRAGEISQRTAEQLQQRQLEQQAHHAEPLVEPPSAPDQSTVDVPPTCERSDVEAVETVASHEVATDSTASTENVSTIRVQASEDTPHAPNEAAAEEEEDPEYALYLQEKLAKIAALKAQFQRVQNLIDTTKLIEQQIDKKSEKEQPEMKPDEQQPNEQQQQAEKFENIELAASAVQTSGNTSSTIAEERNISKLTAMPDTTGITASAHAEIASEASAATSTCNAIENEKEELLGAMMNMFTVFTADLRSQADHLRAERDRLRAIKAELLKKKGLSEN